MSGAGVEREKEKGGIEDFHEGTDLVEGRGLAARGAEMISRRRDVVDADYVVKPIVDLKQLWDAWNQFIEIKRQLLDDKNCYDEIGGEKQMNRTGATRLATAFGLSIEQVRTDEVDIKDGDGKATDHRFVARVRVSKGARYVDGIGSCRVSEIEAGPKASYSQREHFAMSKAGTRALKRAIADIVGGTEAE